ncbi:GATA transcription factor 7-like [Senna tora]|uniref:GATA transcription factor n=1 Tax=Senna tora TaxID=362788 RepID=A0A834SVZ4_9FABA|nr:GATA transcription factor 7-like [Senna tora]
MEVAVAKALKPSLRGELAFQQKAFCDEILCFNANNAASGDDFSVDDLLDFSNGEFHHGFLENAHDFEEEEDDDDKDGSSLSDDVNSNSGSVSVAGDSDSAFASELAVPADDLADLEWVSRFVDDSLPELSLLYPVRSEQAKTLPEKRSEPKARPLLAKTPGFPFEIPKKTRSTKSRKANARACSLSLLLSHSRPSSPPPLSLSSSSSSPGFSSPPALTVAGEPPAKKQKHNKKKPSDGEAGGSQFQRRCTHCHVQKTPQWRTGPLGAKTLCNACGVRFKSGRLFPEYRPACSPTFSSEIHSNSHRKVLEMRRRKETSGPEAGPTQTQIVQSY